MQIFSKTSALTALLAFPMALCHWVSVAPQSPNDFSSQGVKATARRLIEVTSSWETVVDDQW